MSWFFSFLEWISSFWSGKNAKIPLPIGGNQIEDGKEPDTEHSYEKTNLPIVPKCDEGLENGHPSYTSLDQSDLYVKSDECLPETRTDGNGNEQEESLPMIETESGSKEVGEGPALVSDESVVGESSLLDTEECVPTIQKSPDSTLILSQDSAQVDSEPIDQYISESSQVIISETLPSSIKQDSTANEQKVIDHESNLLYHPNITRARPPIRSRNAKIGFLRRASMQYSVVPLSLEAKDDSAEPNAIDQESSPGERMKPHRSNMNRWSSHIASSDPPNGKMGFGMSMDELSGHIKKIKKSGGS